MKKHLFLLILALAPLFLSAQSDLFDKLPRKKFKAKRAALDSLRKGKRFKLRILDSNQTLEPLNIYGPNFQVQTMSGQTISYKRGRHYRGTGKRFTALTLSDNGELLGVCDSMKLTKTGPELDTIPSTIFEPESEPNLPAGTIQSTATPTSGPVIGSSAVSCKEVLIYTEITLPYFRACSTLAGATTIQAGVQATIDRITSIFAVKAGIFFREGIVVKLHSIRVWTTQDPYSTLPATSTMLINFATAKQLEPIWSQYHVASLIDLATGTRNLGGLAYTDQLNKAAKCNVQCLYTSFNTSSYSWTVNCWTHETGHTMSSKHTHWCGWRLPNGTTGRIDSCWSGEGSCGTTSRTSRRGTVMSYCHIGGLIDFNLGFGPLPGNQIRLGLANSTVPCTTTVQPTCTSFTYSAWSACQNGTQTRTVVSASPTNCTGGSPVLSQPCQGLLTGFSYTPTAAQPIFDGTSSTNASRWLAYTTNQEVVITFPSPRTITSLLIETGWLSGTTWSNPVQNITVTINNQNFTFTNNTLTTLNVNIGGLVSTQIRIVFSGPSPQRIREVGILGF